MAIVGVSGSTIANSNTDRIIKAVLENSGKKSKFIKLSNLNFAPCRACAHLCATTNMCGVMDELQPLIKDIRDADALVIGTPINDGEMTGWMYSFITRLWCLNHVYELLNDKPTLFIVTGLGSNIDDKAYDIFSRYIREYHPKILGGIYYSSKIPPCYKCGAGEYCKVGGIWSLSGHDEDEVKRLMCDTNRFRRWEDDPIVSEKIEKYGMILSKIK